MSPKMTAVPRVSAREKQAALLRFTSQTHLPCTCIAAPAVGSACEKGAWVRIAGWSLPLLPTIESASGPSIGIIGLPAFRRFTACAVAAARALGDAISTVGSAMPVLPAPLR